LFGPHRREAIGDARHGPRPHRNPHASYGGDLLPSLILVGLDRRRSARRGDRLLVVDGDLRARSVALPIEGANTLPIPMNRAADPPCFQAK
jgi:hypothetical protein